MAADRWPRDGVPSNPRAWLMRTAPNRATDRICHDRAPTWPRHKAPTVVIWGQRDRYLGDELAEPEHGDVPNLAGVERLPDASHRVHHDEAERVTQLLTDFTPRPASHELTRDASGAGRPAPSTSTT
jgi:pimeloyl-ACP methyl ester carboxylesterase